MEPLGTTAVLSLDHPQSMCVLLHLHFTNWAKTGSMSFQPPKIYVMTLNQRGKLIGFAKSHQPKGILTFNLNPMACEMFC